MPRDPSLLDPWEKLISVTIEGQRLDLPEKNTVLRLLQYLEVDLYPCRLCWNGECDNCRFTFVDPETHEELSAKSCLTEATDGMNITRIPVYALWPDPT